ncbi:MAG: hypothetical protein R3258_10970 [Acidimicrobiia bacterium]|nr:hypothetical protein [Acidimicrobiia bacterium]
MRLDLSRLSGGFLVAPLVLGLVAAGIMIATGAIRAFGAQLRGSLVEMGPYVRVSGIGNILWAVAWTSLLIGFATLTRVLADAGDQYLAKVSLVVVTVAVVLALLEASFGFTVGQWAIREAADTGVTPEIYTVLRGWTNGMQGVYIALSLAATAGFGAALLQTGVISPAVSRFAIIWSLAWLLVLAFGIPALVLVAPAVVGVTLLLG